MVAKPLNPAEMLHMTGVTHVMPGPCAACVTHHPAFCVIYIVNFIKDHKFNVPDDISTLHSTAHRR